MLHRILLLSLFLIMTGSKLYAGRVCEPASEVTVTFKRQGQTQQQKRIFRDENLSASAAYAQYRTYVSSLVVSSNELVELRRKALIQCTESVRRSMSEVDRNSSGALTLYINSAVNECRTVPLGSNALQIECSDGSSAVYHPGTDAVYVKPDTTQLYSNMEQQTQAMKALLNQMEILKRDWKPQSRSVTMGGPDFEKTIELIRREAQGGPALKLPEELAKELTNFKMNPLNEILDKAFKNQQSRLTRFAGINNASSMTKEQTTWYFDRYVQGLERLDNLQQKNSRASHGELTRELQQNIDELVNIAPGKLFSQERRAAAQAVVDSFAPGGIVSRPSNNLLDQALQELQFKSSLHDPSLPRREDAGRIRQVFNELSWVAAFGSSQKTPEYLAAMSWVKDADELLTLDDSEINQIRGQRLLDQAELFTQFETGQRPAPFNLTSGEISLYNVNPDTNTFSGYVLGNLIRGLAGAVGSENDAYLHFHASTAVRNAQREALQGNLSMFNAFVQTAYSVLDFAEGMATRVLTVTVSSVDGTLQFIQHPIDSGEALLRSVMNLEISQEIIVNAIRTKARESMGWTFNQAGQFTAEVLMNIVGAAADAGHIMRGASGLAVAEKIKDAGTSVDLVPGMNGYLKLKEVYPGVDNDLPNLENLPSSLVPFVDAPAEFMKTLGKKLDNKEMTLGMASHMSMFKNGAVRIVLEKDMQYYPPGTTLKAAAGRSEQIFVIPKDKLPEVLAKTQGGNAAEMERLLGFDPGSLVGERLVALEIPMDWKYNPWLPTGWEKAANRHFRYGGYTSGGLPELRMEKVLIDDTKRIDLGLFK